MPERIENPIAKAAAWLRADGLDLLLAIGDIETMGLGPAHASIEEDYTYLKKTLQHLAKEAGIVDHTRPTAHPAPVSIADTTEHANPSLRVEPETETPRPASRRRHRYEFDAALLVAVHMGSTVAYPHPVGLDTLFKVARALDPIANRASLVAKLNRWKADKLLQWREHTAINTLPAGIQKLKELHRLCGVPDGGLDVAIAAVKSVLRVEPTFPS